MQSNVNNFSPALALAPGLCAVAPGVIQVSNNEIPKDWKSIFIPRISFEVSRQELVEIVENQLYMGFVSRIDFAPANNGSGRMAFIHMVDFHPTAEVDAIRKEMEVNGYWVLPDYLQKDSIKIRFVINRNPVPKTEFTMETLADAVARQGYTVEDHTEHMRVLEGQMAQVYQQIATQDGNANRIFDTLYGLNSMSHMLFKRLIKVEEEHATIINMLKNGYKQEFERANKAEEELREAYEKLEKYENLN